MVEPRGPVCVVTGSFMAATPPGRGCDWRSDHGAYPAFDPAAPVGMASAPGTAARPPFAFFADLVRFVRSPSARRRTGCSPAGFANLAPFARSPPDPPPSPNRGAIPGQLPRAPRIMSRGPSPVRRDRCRRRLWPPPPRATTMTRTDNPYEHGLDKRPANFVPLSPISFLERSAMVYPDKTAVVHGRRRTTYAELHARCRRLAGALAGRGVGVGDTVSLMAPNIPEMLEAHFGVPMCGAVLNPPELPARRRHDPFHPRTRRDDGADHRSRVLAGDRAGARGDGRSAGGDRHRRPAVRERRAARREGLRGVHRRGIARVRVPPAGRRVAGDQPRLHVGDHRQPQGRRGPPPRRVPERGRADARVRHRGALALPVDAADVPLQRLDVHLGRHRGGRDPRLPADRRSRPDLRAHRGARGDPHVRGAGGAQPAAPCPRSGQAPLRARGRGGHRRRGAAERGHRGDVGDGVRRHPPLRAHRNLRAGHRLRVAGGVGRAGHAGARGPDGPPGRQLPHHARDDGGGRRDDGRDPPATARPSAS